MRNLIDRFRTICIIAPIVLLCALYLESMILLTLIAIYFNWLEFVDMSFSSNNGQVISRNCLEAALTSLTSLYICQTQAPIIGSLIFYGIFSFYMRLSRKPECSIFWILNGLFSFCFPLQLLYLIREMKVLFLT